MLTPSNALEANYGITYQNKISFTVNPFPNDIQVLTRTQEISGAFVHSFNYRKFNPFFEAGPGAMIFLPILNSGNQDSRTPSSRPTSASSMAPVSPMRSAPASTFARSIAGLSPKCPILACIRRAPTQSI